MWPSNTNSAHDVKDTLTTKNQTMQQFRSRSIVLSLNKIASFFRDYHHLTRCLGLTIDQNRKKWSIYFYALASF